jgi:hypothetical protein
MTRIKVTGLNFVRSSIPVVSVLTAMEQNIINAAVSREIAELERKTFCALAGIDEKEYELRQRYPKLSEPLPAKEIIDLKFKEGDS